MSEATRPPQAYSGDDTPLVDLIDYDSVADEDLSRIVAIDVECVASGTGPRDRVPGRVVAVGWDGEAVFDAYIRPEAAVRSCLTPLTGIEEEHLIGAASLEDVRAAMLKALPARPILLGWSVHHDVHWLGLKHGEHHDGVIDVSHMFRLQKRGTKSKPDAGFLYFSLRHAHAVLLKADGRVRAFRKRKARHKAQALSAVAMDASPSTAGASLHSSAGATSASMSAGDSTCAAPSSGVSSTESTAHDPAWDALAALQLFKAFRAATPVVLKQAVVALAQRPRADKTPRQMFPDGIDGVLL